MKHLITQLLQQVGPLSEQGTSIIPWGSPVPSFGNPSVSKAATLGLNPSNKEFVDDNGDELVGISRRFHTLNSLELENWAHATCGHIEAIHTSCCYYFQMNPYDRWFGKLENLISDTGFSFYEGTRLICHLDVIPFATQRKWTELTGHEKLALTQSSADVLAMTIRESPIEMLILNGRSVVNAFQSLSNVALTETQVPEWDLPRRSGSSIPGFRYSGVFTEISGCDLGREIHVWGFNHNLQSSFGITKKVTSAIRDGLTRTFETLKL